MLVLENVEHENYVNNLCPLSQDRLRKTVQDFGFHFPVMCSPEELLQNNEDN
jgi:hypothetical protein